LAQFKNFPIDFLKISDTILIMRKVLLLFIFLLIALILYFLSLALMPGHRVSAPSFSTHPPLTPKVKSGFRGPTGPPQMKGPTSPPPSR